MLQLKNITKTYDNGGQFQTALRNVSLNFRDNEFVAILGQSGSGKTTLLNIIGGLDRYDDGDLIINNVSTKDYKDRDWDSYRNHTIGFVFQSYNLIPHQTVLSNVELALTIGGISAKERRERAIKALEEVDLHDQIDKKPNQLSGGQMQRVAIARALVNNPDILLADEPTGALDTKTSVQVMELLKKVAKDKLVVMVTHNPELADEYANRIVRLKDGEIIDDTNPLVIDETNLEKPKYKNLGKSSMSLLTSFALSFNNLLTKKGRTILTAFAGSIGIIGIALILSLSQGFQNYIDKIQEDTLSSYPLTITSETADASSIILSMVGNDGENDESGVVKENQFLQTMFSSVGTNDVRSFKKHLDTHEEELKNDVSNIRYTYSISPLIYSYDVKDNLVQLNPSSMMSMMYSNSAASLLSSYSSSMGIFSEMSNDREAIMESYDVLAGRWPEKYNEMIIVLSEPNGISDLLVYSLGLRDTSELRDMFTKIAAGETIDAVGEPNTYTYEELMNIEMRLINPSNLYKYNEKYDVYEDMTSDKEYMKDVYKHSEALKIVGIVCAKEGSGSLTLSPGVAYSRDLIDYVIKHASESEIVKKQLANKEVDVFSGKRFDDEEEKKSELNFNDMISIDEKKLTEAFKVNVDFSSLSDTEKMQNTIIDKSKEVAKSLEDTTASIYQELIKQFSQGTLAIVGAYPTTFTVNVPNDGSCPLGYASPMNRLSGCKLPEETDPDYGKYKQVKGISLDPQNPFTTISVYEDQYGEYAIFNEMATAGYKSAAINKETLQVDALVTIAGNSFDEYVKQAITLVDPSDMLIAMAKGVKTSDLANIDINKIVSDELAKTSNQDAIQKLAVDSAGEYTYLLVAKGMGEALGDVLIPLTNLGDKEMMTIDTQKFAEAFNFNMNEDELSRLMETMMAKGNEKNLSSNLIGLGYQDKDNPTSISISFYSFEAKENFLKFLDEYNDSVPEETQIHYTDITGILMSSVKTIVDSVTYVLIAFVSISLIVSSIMIAVITLISVMERTKEIGILRAIGASKHNVSSIFNAETFIIGLLSGLIGIGATLLLIIPINKIIHSVTGNPNITAVLPFNAAITLIIISVLLTLIAGFIPSKTAAKKDPVVALRTE